ncbi:hypothetical protein NMY3_02991 [Candidatus Nitrosocosmicus oleophilus]|uniref:Uncharacterized protein n=1 Tax=Candidatus Nitrosocosmicus oleophilus TaxID=1353260 RepID=A0A654M0C4_9ARCH|nr:hypothetical protein NMY3_02991 [Candidatus Nitrosocosmicus oleophilus]
MISFLLGMIRTKGHSYHICTGESKTQISQNSQDARLLIVYIHNVLSIAFSRLISLLII